MKRLRFSFPKSIFTIFFAISWLFSVAALGENLKSSSSKNQTQTLGLSGETSITLRELLESVEGRFLLTETERGAEITERVLGRRLANPTDFNAFLEKISQSSLKPLANRLAERIGRIKERYEAQFPRQDKVDFLLEDQKAVLRGFASKELKIEILDTSAHSAGNTVRETFIRMVESRPGTPPTLRYPLGIDPMIHPDWNLQFGFESEYTLSETEKLLEVYGPRPSFGIAPEQWLHQMSGAERVQWVKANISRLFPAQRVQGGLVKLANEPELGFLPDFVILDSTLNLEIILSPVQTLEEWVRNITTLNKRFGTGSMQGTVSCPSDAFFGRGFGKSAQEATEENLGFFTVGSEMDALEKLEVGAARYQADPTRAVANTFKHPFLGPLTRAKQERLLNFLQSNAVEELFDPTTLRSISGSDASFKYIGSTAYRPDIIGPSRVIMEVRDAHNHMPTLMDRILRNVFYLQYGRAGFRQTSRLQAFDAVADFEKLSQEIQIFLKELFPQATLPNVQYNDAETTALQVYRNFAYPLRNWNDHIALFGDSGLAQKISEAQRSYLNALQSIEGDFRATRISREQASLRVQGALTQFAADTKVLQALRSWQAKHLFNDPRWASYVTLMMNEMSPLAEAFASSNWQGSLNSKVTRLLSRWPRNVAWVDMGQRRALIVSGSDLTPEQITQLRQDYLDALSEGTLSFSLEGEERNLALRLGNRLFQKTTQALSQSNYPEKPWPRTETVITLKPEEELKLRFYVEAGKADPFMVFGNETPQGCVSGKTRGDLRDNRPLLPMEGHNGTTWVTTAPIGANSHIPLAELLGADIDQGLHANPVLWFKYLQSAAPSDRIPFMVYWTPETLQNAQLSFLHTHTHTYK